MPTNLLHDALLGNQPDSARFLETPDGATITGGPIAGGVVESRGDHRIAMAFTVAALAAEGESYLEGAECVGVSFPEFFQLLDSVTER